MKNYLVSMRDLRLYNNIHSVANLCVSSRIVALKLSYLVQYLCSFCELRFLVIRTLQVEGSTMLVCAISSGDAYLSRNNES